MVEFTITISSYEPNFFDGCDGLETVDESATITKYQELVKNQIKSIYPEADVEFENRGCVTTQISVYPDTDWKTEENIQQTVGEVLAGVWNNSDDFIIEKQ